MLERTTASMKRYEEDMEVQGLPLWLHMCASNKHPGARKLHMPQRGSCC